MPKHRLWRQRQSSRLHRRWVGVQVCEEGNFAADGQCRHEDGGNLHDFNQATRADGTHAIIAHWQGTMPSLYEPSQWVALSQLMLNCLGCSEKVRIIIPYLGGAFGSKRSAPRDSNFAAAARQIKRPLKVVMSHR